ncbi:MAG TPA: glutamine-hydrolyzing GMP synthase [Phycisphaerae bacterium]|nr:glutamine-hydrolyzing GMP synthase [Phycisphaerae bacterium]HOI54198.1 glutamine-hydrolyzing GMP synthase [Phycisphaerae bacterium]
MAQAPRDELVVVIDFGSQYGQLIARRVREQQVYCRILSHRTTAAEIAAMKPVGIILSGGPASVYEPGAPRCDEGLFKLGIPILGICYGMQLSVQILGGKVDRADRREYGRAKIDVIRHEPLFHGLADELTVWMSHGDQVHAMDGRFEVLARTATCPYAAARTRDGSFYGVQFHPEVTHTPEGRHILHNFLYRVCGCTGQWRTEAFIESQIEAIRRQVGDACVVCGLSGGVDSSVVAALVHRAIGDQLTCVFVNNGLLRLNEPEMVEDVFRQTFGINLRVAQAEEQFLSQLAGVVDPQEKRLRIGHTFIEIFKQQAAAIPNARFLAQGTIYPDVIESGAREGGAAAVIKHHHNVGGLPKELGFELVEPLRDLFKDEVRAVGTALGLPRDLILRHPFPGPGLAVRIAGEVTRPRLDILRQADHIILEEIRIAGLYDQIGQAFGVLLPIQTVGVMGDCRTYESVLAVRAVETSDFMTADWFQFPYDVLATISNRIINEVRGVNRVVYDVSSKPPATIEWE